MTKSANKSKNSVMDNEIYEQNKLQSLMTFYRLICRKELMRFLVIFILLSSVSGCTSLDQKQLTKVITSNNPAKAFKKHLEVKSYQYKQSPSKIITDLEQLAITLKEFSRVIESLWGKNNSQIASKKKYVKYTHHYQSKAQVDFKLGIIKIETIAKNRPLHYLKEAIVMALLTAENPSNTNIFNDKFPNVNGKPYLLGQVLDQDLRSIAYHWRASRFADYLIKTKLVKDHSKKREVYSVEINMVSKHSQLRKHKYATYVLAAANRYQIKPALIYAIIETESSFNPFAVSPANAYGLMQVVPTTAGKDVYQRILNRPGIPNKETLFSAKDNIDIGTAYLHLLEQQYLKKINNPQSRHYSIISAYNGGAGNVFKTFSSQRAQAPRVINALSANQVYQKLTKEHPKAESRHYLYKVITAEKSYR